MTSQVAQTSRQRLSLWSGSGRGLCYHGQFSKALPRRWHLSRSIVLPKLRGAPVLLSFCRGISMKVERLGYLTGRILFWLRGNDNILAAMRWINIIEINLLFNLQPLLLRVTALLIWASRSVLTQELCCAPRGVGRQFSDHRS